MDHSKPARLRIGHLLFGLLAVAALLSAIAALWPGTFRLVLMQPLRDLVFFQREIDPWHDFAAIERHRPIPSRSVRLESADDDIALELDEWHPAVNTAPVVLLLHGSSPRGRALGFNRLLAERLQAGGWLVLTPDLRGFGGSGRPRDFEDPAAWSVQADMSRLVAYARNHPQGNGTVVAIGHSLGASYLLQAEQEFPQLAAKVLIGPRRYLPDHVSSRWERVRFSSDRRIARIVPHEVKQADLHRTDILGFAARRPPSCERVPTLLMDGELEGERTIGVLREAADRMGCATHVTVPGSHHYCGAYQLPWPSDTVFLRPEIFERCFSVLTAFLAHVNNRTEL